MSPQDAYSILEAIAEIHGCTDKLKLIPPSADVVAAADTAEDIEEQKKEHLAPPDSHRSDYRILQSCRRKVRTDIHGSR